MVRDLVVLGGAGAGSEGAVPPGWVPAVDVGDRRPVLDVAHPDAEVRGRFPRRPLQTFEALVWTDPGEPLPAGLGPYTEAFRLRVETHVGWRPPDPAAARPGDAVKQVSLLCAADGYDRPTFAAHYRHHVELARRHMPALWQYVQNDVVSSTAPAGSPPFVAVSELWFATRSDFCHRYFPSEQDQRQFSAAEGFLDLSRAVSFVCTSLVPEESA